MKKILLLLLLSSYLLFPQEEITKSSIALPVPSMENGGIGNMLVGLDLDNDGKKEMYVVNNNIADVGNELIPRIYKYEWNGTKWDSVWSATMDMPAQNTWPALTTGDLDNDGKPEVIWGPVNNFNGGQLNPSRIIVFEVKGDGSDILGVSNGFGGYTPNAKWSITESESFDLRPFRWIVYDIDKDNKKEIIFCDRSTSTMGYRFGVVGVSTIPDDGNGSEQWTMKFSGQNLSTLPYSTWDLAVMDSSIYVIFANGTVATIECSAGTYTLKKTQAALVPGGSWKTAQVVDIDNDGTKEIVCAGWSGSSSTKIFLLQKSADSLKATVIANFSALIGTAGTARIYGSTFGDFNNNGKIDLIFGTRDASPNASMARLEYIGGSITDTANYKKTLLDKGASTGGRWDELVLVNVDADPYQEFFYTSGYGSPEPIRMVKLLATGIQTIAQVRIDADNDGQPDRLNDTVTVVGVVNSLNYTVSSNRMSYYIQDATGALTITKAVTGGGPVLKIGSRVSAHGKLGFFRGSTQIELFDLATDLSILDTNVAITAQAITLEDYLANPESFEGEYVKLLGVGKAPTSVAWPANTDANMTIWNGKLSITLRVDKDTDLDNNPEPVFPVNVFGVATQYTSAATVYLDGYQLTPNFYTDFEQNVAVPPSKYFYLKSPKNGDTLTITDSNQVVSIKWTKALDLNGDTVNYRVVLLTSPNQTGATITDTVWNTTGKQVLQWLGSKDTLLTKWTVKAKGKETALISSVDTFTILLIKKITNDVRIDYIPVAFYVEQNYPNPFNPSTSIKFGLNKEMKTDLRVYNILGQEVTVLIDNELLKAGTYIKTFQANKLASGAYFYRLRTDNNVETKKMLLVR